MRVVREFFRIEQAAEIVSRRQAAGQLRVSRRKRGGAVCGDGIYLYLVFFNMFHFLYESLPNGIHIFVSDTSVGRHAAFPGSGSLPSLSDTEAAEYLVEKLFAGVKPEQRRQLPSGLGKTGKDQVVTQIGEECLASGLDGLLRP